MKTQQTWDPKSYAENARFVSDLGAPLLELLAPRDGERILDIGCGDGVLTQRLLATGATVVGVDSSPEFIAAAQASGIDARLMEAKALSFDREFDAVFSNAVLHWVRDHEPVLMGVARALKPGGRFVAEFGGYGNVQTIVEALETILADYGLKAEIPWYFPSADEYAAKLESHEFVVRRIDLIPRFTPLPTGIEAWLEVFASPVLRQVALEDRPEALRKIVELCRPRLCDASGNWSADYVRLRFAADRAYDLPR